jgi:hypothetical protein
MASTILSGTSDEPASSTFVEDAVGAQRDTSHCQ